MTHGRIYHKKRGYLASVEPEQWTDNRTQAKLFSRYTYEVVYQEQGCEFVKLGEDEKMKAAGANIAPMLPGFGEQ